MSDGQVSILLVDDRPEKLLALEAVLEELGLNIVRAYSGREALRCVLNQEFAVIILDINMPAMDGFETATLIRQRQSTRDTPIIFVTAYPDEMHVVRGYSLGAVDYILAPVIPEVLRTKVSVFAQLYRQTVQVRRQASLQHQRAVQLQKLASAAVAINSSRSVPKMLQILADCAREIIVTHQAIASFALGQTPAAAEKSAPAAGSFSEKYADWRKHKLWLDSTILTRLVQNRRVVRMDHRELLDQVDAHAMAALGVPPIGDLLAAPLVAGNGPQIGILYLTEKCEGSFTQDDEHILTQLAQMGSVALENTLYAAELEANRAKDEFLATISHELRTPLNAIMGWAQLLRSESLPQEAAHGIEVIERNARAQTKLIEDLLDISRITARKLRLELRPIPLAGVIEAALDSIRPSADAKGVVIESILPPVSDAVLGDSTRLQQVVCNLLSNAVKFTDSGGRVQVTLKPSEHGVCVAVSDTGRGIAPEFLPHVFDRFRQADSSSRRGHGGLGIGLAIVRHLVELHGGTVSAHSDGVGCGATFMVELPRLPATSPLQLENLAPAVHSLGSAGELDKVHVLIVDDDADARDVIGSSLRRLGARVTAAASAQEAMTELARGRPDVLVSDIAMPDQDGYDLIRAVRRLPAGEGGNVPAVAMTAYAREEDRLRALRAGFQAHLSKPADAAALAAAINAVRQSLATAPMQ